MRAPETLQYMQKHEKKGLVDYQPLFSILSPVHRLHHSLRTIEASGSEIYNRKHVAEGTAGRETAIVPDNDLTSKISSQFQIQFSLLKDEKISGLVEESIRTTAIDENEMKIDCVSNPAPYDIVCQILFHY